MKVFKKVFLIFLQIIFLIFLIFSGIKIYNWWKENSQNQEVLQKISNNTQNQDISSENIDFKSLKAENSDTVAYLEVPGTNINYPIVKSSDNDFYLTHNFNKKSNSAGWIFMDYRNKFDGTDKNIIIYGHNRKDGSMFGTLKNILTQDWQNNESNESITFITDSGKYIYKVFSVYKVKNENYYTQTEFSDGEFRNFIKNLKSRSIKNFESNVKFQDKIITLSTCADNDDYRIVLHAKKSYKVNN